MAWRGRKIFSYKYLWIFRTFEHKLAEQMQFTVNKTEKNFSSCEYCCYVYGIRCFVFLFGLKIIVPLLVNKIIRYILFIPCKYGYIKFAMMLVTPRSKGRRTYKVYKYIYVHNLVIDQRELSRFSYVLLYIRLPVYRRTCTPGFEISI